MMERNLRPRCTSQYVSQREWQMEVQEEDDFILARRYNVLEKFHNVKYEEDHGFVKEMKGEDFNFKYIQENGFVHSVVFRNPKSLGIRMPPPDFTVADIKKLVGARRKVDVIDTLTQDSVTMSLGQWTKYYETFPRQRLLNIISLEISCTKLDQLVEAPTIVKELDWVEQVWPVDLKNKQTNPTNDLNKMMYPKVQKYCLMSVANCYTDFHLDFGGTSVWYHVLKGEKQFLLIPPSSRNYALFQQWQMSGEQERIFLAELMEKAQLVYLHAGDTFIMPAGWIHAVYTPLDSIVFGGNFLHSFNIAQQLLVAEMERSTKVPLRLTYPFYGTIHWYVLVKYAQELKKLIAKKKVTSVVESDCPINGSQQWLKGVAIQKCSIASPNCETGSLVSCTSKGDVIQSQALLASKENENKECTPNCSLGSRSPSPTGPKPHFSSHERGGLLLLVQKMKNKLFEQDTPPCINSSSDLLRDIESLLNTAMSDRYSSLEPSGVGILQEKYQAHTRKRMRKHSLENHKSKVHKTSHIKSSVSSAEDISTFDDIDSPHDCDVSESELFTSSASSPSASATATICLPSATSASCTAEIRVAIEAVYSPNSCLSSNGNITATSTEQCRVEKVGELLSASSPTPLSTEATIIKLPNPAYINM